MATVTLDHFKRAATDIAESGDNDTLPFDIDTRFIAENKNELARIAFDTFQALETKGGKNAVQFIDSLQIFSERLLVPAGPAGFRITTKIHPFWNLYFNALGVAIAEKHEPQRNDRAHSYRFATTGTSIFSRDATWRAYLQATRNDERLEGRDAIVVKTDIGSFYEHIYHHPLENCIDDLIPKKSSTVSDQVDRLLNHFSSQRSFGLPVGGQCSRVLAELFLSSIDQRLSDTDIAWHRYVDDITMIVNNHGDAYRALSALSNALADYGLSLNRTKTTIMTAKHYCDYVQLQLGTSDDEAGRLKEIDLHFDPYSDTALSDFEELKETVENIDIQNLLKLELEKTQPDTFLVSQIGRTLKLHEPGVSLQLCATLLEPKNLHAFRGSWATIMRGVAALRSDEGKKEIYENLDLFIDGVLEHSTHLLVPDTNCLHFLKVIRSNKTDKRARYVSSIYGTTRSKTIRRACIDCWTQWKDRANFKRAWNEWTTLSPEEQRMLWLAAASFGEEGEHFRKKAKKSVLECWKLGIERGGSSSFASTYMAWA